MSTTEQAAPKFDDFAAMDYDPGLYRDGQVAEYVESLSAITDADLDRYREQGYLERRSHNSRAVLTHGQRQRSMAIIPTIVHDDAAC